MKNNLIEGQKAINYPRTDLRYSLEKALQLYKTIGDEGFQEIVIVQKLGYKDLTGRAIAVVAALKKYALLEKHKKANETVYSVSMLAKKVFNPLTPSEERAAAIKKAAFSPAIFARIYSRYENHLPEPEELNDFLTKINIADRTRSRIIPIYEKTFLFALAEHNDFWLYQAMPGTSSDKPSPLFSRDGGSKSPAAHNPDRLRQPEVESSAATTTLVFTIVGNLEARVHFNSEHIEGRHIESLIQYLQLHKNQNFPQ